MQRIKLPKIQGHYLTLTLNSPILTLEIEEESSGRTFSLDLDEESIIQVTDGLFPTIEDFFKGLQDVCPGIALSLSRGKLTYTVDFPVGETQRHSFTLNMSEKRMDQMEVLERKLQFLEQWKEEHESEILIYQEELQKNKKEVEDLKNLFQIMSLKIDQKLDGLERKVPIVSKPEVSFNHASVNCSHFELSNNNKTATSIFGTFACLEILPQIPSSGQHSYMLRIDNDCKKWICFGITTRTGNAYWDENQHNYRYCISDGRIYGRASQRPVGDGPFGGKDSIIKMIVDMDQGILTFYVDEKKVNSCHISKNGKYFAEISLGHAGDSVTLI